MIRRDTGSGARQPGAKKRIGELLIHEGVISDNQLKEALTIQSTKGGKIVEVLISMSALTVQNFLDFLSKQPGVASIELANYQVPGDIVSLVPKEIAVELEVFPIDKMGKLLTLGMACPLDSKAIGRIEEQTNLRVKALLCSPEDIRSAIRRYYPPDKEPAIEESVAPGPTQETVSKIETGLRISAVSRLIKELKTLPALPATIGEIRDAMEDVNHSMDAIAKIILRDPPVVANVLSVANSAAYGFRNQVTSVELAVSLLGLRETYSIVLSAAVLDLFEKTETFDYKVYWEEAINSAAACRIIGEHAHLERERGLYTAGLLHDIGRIALMETIPEQYIKVSSDLTGDELIAAEQEAVGISHTEAGYELATQWNLPAEIAEPIRFHHQPEEESPVQNIVCVVALAELWTRTHILQDGPKDQILAESAPILKLLGMDAPAANQAYDGVAYLERKHFEWNKS